MFRTWQEEASSRRGRWWPRRPWKSPGLARERFQKRRQLLKDTENNDKFKVEQLHWAKEGLIAGAAVSWKKELASRVEEDITVLENPGGSAEAAKEIPGKHALSNYPNTFLPGHSSDEGQVAGQEVQHQTAGAVQDDQEQVQGGGVGHQQHGVKPDALLSSVRGDQQVQEEGGGGGYEQQQGGSGDQDGVDAGAWDDDGAPHEQASALVGLKHPDQGVSPGYVKSRRRRKQDGLVQMPINSRLFFLKKQIVPSVGLSGVPSGGPCVAKESERGLKRGLDLMEGPIARKRLREDLKLGS